MRYFILILSLVFVSNAEITLPFPPSAGDKLRAAEVEANFDTVYNAHNTLRSDVEGQYMKISDYNERDSVLKVFGADTLYSDSATFKLLKTDSGTITVFNSATGTITTLGSTTITTDTARITGGSSQRYTIDTLISTKATITDLNATTLSITSISGDSMYSDAVECQRLRADSLFNSIRILDSLFVDKIIVCSTDIKTPLLNSDSANMYAIDVGRISSDTILTNIRALRNLIINGNLTVDTLGTQNVFILNDLSVSGKLSVDTIVTALRLLSTLNVDGLSTLSSVDINGGNIDNTVIGAAVALAGTFTTLTSDSSFSVVHKSQRGRFDTLFAPVINTPTINGALNSNSTALFTTITSDSSFSVVHKSQRARFDSILGSVVLPNTTIDGTFFSNNGGFFSGTVTMTDINTGNGATEIYDMDHDLKSTDTHRADSVFSTRGINATTLNTGQGNNELYAMDQNVLTTSGPTFNTLEISSKLGINTPPTSAYHLAIRNSNDASTYPLIINNDNGNELIRLQQTSGGNAQFGIFANGGLRCYFDANGYNYLNNNTLIGTTSGTPLGVLEVDGSIVSDGTGAGRLTIRNTASTSGKQAYSFQSNSDKLELDLLSDDLTSELNNGFVKFSPDSVEVPKITTGLGATELYVQNAGSVLCTLYNDNGTDSDTVTVGWQRNGNIVHLVLKSTASVTYSGSVASSAKLHLSSAPSEILPSSTQHTPHTNNFYGAVTNNNNQPFGGVIIYSSPIWQIWINPFNGETYSTETLTLSEGTYFSYLLYTY